jgi:hypothetical protein
MSCRVGDVLAKHAPALIQLMTARLPGYHMRLITTKCLNTAVTLMYLTLGERALQHTRYCDVPVVLERSRKGGPSRLVVYDGLRARVLDPAATNHRVFYVMLTDAQLGAVYFPGHVFIMEVWTTRSGKRVVRIHQSYINAYRSNASGPRAPAKVLDEVHAILGSPTWDAKCVKAWKSLTGVDSTKFLGCSTKGIELCFREADVPEGDCGVHLQRVVTAELAALKGADPAATWGGDPEIYRGSDVTPLTNGQMRAELTAILHAA